LQLSIPATLLSGGWGIRIVILVKMSKKKGADMQIINGGAACQVILAKIVGILLGHSFRHSDEQP